MFGKNPARPPVKGDGTTLDVQEIFPTLQGEGPLAGTPAVFVRLGGCNLTCSFCDTEFEDFRAMHLEDILAAIVDYSVIPAQAGIHLANKGVDPGLRRNDLKDESRKVRKLVVITGGEPLRQPIERFCEALLAAGYIVQIETNGTLWRPLPEAVRVVVSPKNTGQGYAPLRPDVLARAEAVKFIISESNPLYHDIGEVGQSPAQVYIQPMDEYDEAKNAANLKRCLELTAHTGARLSLQLHKMMGIP